MLLLALLACERVTDPADPVPGPGLLPFPRADMVHDGHLALPDDLPAAATPWPTERLNLRTGFSPVQTAVVAWDQPLDPASLPGLDTLGTPGAVTLWDLETGEAIPCFAELDAWPDYDEGHPPMLVRPGRPVADGHTVALVLSSEVRTADGAPITSPAWFEALRAGQDPEGMEGSSVAYADLLARLEDLGVTDVALATHWPVQDTTALLRDLVAASPTPAAWTLAEAAEAPPQAWRQLSGSFTTTSWLDASGRLVLDADGAATPQGDVEAHLFVHISQAAAAAGPGQAPVWVFGHGIFASPELYLTDAADGDAVLDLAERAGAIVVGTVWRGLTTADITLPVNVGNDIGTIHRLTDHLAQGVSDTTALIRLITEGDLLSDPLFGGFADPTTVRYYGISLGAIEGAVTLGLGAPIDHAVLHVGGSTWSTMLERSSHWSTFEGLVTATVRDPVDRQLAYALTQLAWDPVDPALYAADLVDRSVLWQVALGDDQVSNLTTWTLLRGVGATGTSPAAASPWGLTDAAPPLTGPAFTVFDPDLGQPDGDNRPAAVTRAHNLPRTWEGARAQTLRFLDSIAPGVVSHPCGAAPCTVENPGE